jgi:hypothetical protein
MKLVLFLDHSSEKYIIENEAIKICLTEAITSKNVSILFIYDDVDYIKSLVYKFIEKYPSPMISDIESFTKDMIVFESGSTIRFKKNFSCCLSSDIRGLVLNYVVCSLPINFKLRDDLQAAHLKQNKGEINDNNRS